MVGSLIAFRSRRFIACHSKPSVLNNAGVMWCAKESRMRVLMISWSFQDLSRAYGEHNDFAGSPYGNTQKVSV